MLQLFRKDYYFAYGSNMSSKHLRQRIRSARSIGAASLHGYRWRCNKLGPDATGKANIEAQTDSIVHGVLYTLHHRHLKELDRIENGYRRLQLDINFQGEIITAWCYQSQLLTTRMPESEYLTHIIAGMIEHRLPDTYIRELRSEAGI